MLHALVRKMYYYIVADQESQLRFFVAFAASEIEPKKRMFLPLHRLNIIYDHWMHFKMVSIHIVSGRAYHDLVR